MKRLANLTVLLFLFPSVLSAQIPEAIKIVRLEYPRLAVAAGIRGTVEIRCSLAVDGTVASAEIMEAVADINDPALKEIRSKAVRDLLGSVAQENALQWTFKVATGQRAVTVLTYVFTIEGKDRPSGQSRFVFESPNLIRVIAEGYNFPMLD